MKFAKEHFPKGTFEKQQTDGAYIDETLGDNIDIIAESMHKDIAPMGAISGENQSGTGKTTIGTHIACKYTHKVNQKYGLKNTFTCRNIFFKIDKLLKEAPIIAKEQPYSVLLLDEQDDLTIHHAKQRAHDLKGVVMRLRQLNIFLLITSHSFFELPKFYALNRSQFLVNVKFEGKFDRGYFKFYGPKSKKLLYLNGKKEWDYDAHRYDFQGRFFSSYCFFPNCAEETEKYKRQKYQDMMDTIEGKDKGKEPLREVDVKSRVFRNAWNELRGEITQKRLAEAFGVSLRTAGRYCSEESNPLKEEKAEA